MNYKNMRYVAAVCILLPQVSNGMICRSLALRNPKTDSLALRESKRISSQKILFKQTRSFSARAADDLRKLIAVPEFKICEAHNIIKTMESCPANTLQVHTLIESLIFSATEFSAREKEYVDLLKELAEKGWTKKSNSATPMVHSAVISGLPAITEELLRQDKNGVCDLDLNKCTPLHYAWLPNIAYMLLENRADIHAVDCDGNTPLHTVSADVVSLLLAEGADGNRFSKKSVRVPSHGWATLTPLRKAVDEGDVKKFLALVSAIRIYDREKEILRSLAHLRFCRERDPLVKERYKHIHEVLGYLPNHAFEVAEYFTNAVVVGT